MAYDDGVSAGEFVALCVVLSTVDCAVDAIVFFFGGSGNHSVSYKVWCKLRWSMRKQYTSTNKIQKTWHDANRVKLAKNNNSNKELSSQTIIIRISKSKSNEMCSFPQMLKYI